MPSHWRNLHSRQRGNKAWSWQQRPKPFSTGQPQTDRAGPGHKWLGPLYQVQMLPITTIDAGASPLGHTAAPAAPDRSAAVGR
jgi:hypothetical protein